MPEVISSTAETKNLLKQARSEILREPLDDSTWPDFARLGKTRWVVARVAGRQA